VAALTVLLEPGSELRLIEYGFEQSAMGDLLQKTSFSIGAKDTLLIDFWNSLVEHTAELF